jgi:hypothetical protein
MKLQTRERAIRVRRTRLMDNVVLPPGEGLIP